MEELQSLKEAFDRSGIVRANFHLPQHGQLSEPFSPLRKTLMNFTLATPPQGLVLPTGLRSSCRAHAQLAHEPVLLIDAGAKAVLELRPYRRTLVQGAGEKPVCRAAHGP